MDEFLYDFCQLKIESLVICSFSRRGVYGLLGWRIAKGAKGFSFAQTFIMSDAQLSFEEHRTCYRKKATQAGRRRKLVQPFLDGGLSDARLLASLKGKLLTRLVGAHIAMLISHDVAGENLHSHARPLHLPLHSWRRLRQGKWGPGTMSRPYASSLTELASKKGLWCCLERS